MPEVNRASARVTGSEAELEGPGGHRRWRRVLQGTGGASGAAGALHVVSVRPRPLKRRKECRREGVRRRRRHTLCLRSAV